MSPRSQPRSDQHDRLTGLLDRRSLLQRMGEALAADEPVVLLHLALDRFRRVNQALGSASGDLALCRIASQLRAWAQDELPLARWGGDEFMFLLVGDIANHEAAEHLARHCIEDCARPLCLDGRWLSLSASVGLASSQTSRDGPGPAAWPCPLHQLVNAAEDALLRAKRRGGDCCLWATDADLSPGWSPEGLALETRLADAVNDGSLVLHYQPQVDTRSGAPLGLEALLRWRQPDGELWLPGRFLDVAETSGAIVDIGAWVLREACTQMRRWQAQGLPPLNVSVNVSARQCRGRQLLHAVRSALAASGLPASRLKLEITETAALADVEQVGELLTELRHLGVGVAMDDFGTGYSSLSQLARLPIDQIKVDRSFIQRVHRDDASGVPAGEDSQGAAIVRATIVLAHALGIPVVAEGVETAEQLHFLARQGCDAAQGYHCARPLPAEAVGDYLRQVTSRSPSLN